MVHTSHEGDLNYVTYARTSFKQLSFIPTQPHLTIDTAINDIELRRWNSRRTNVISVSFKSLCPSWTGVNLWLAFLTDVSLYEQTGKFMRELFILCLWLLVLSCHSNNPNQVNTAIHLSRVSNEHRLISQYCVCALMRHRWLSFNWNVKWKYLWW